MRRNKHLSSGFTLVELMVAMVILAIGIMATLAMQFSSLAGAMISRDNSNAADIGKRVIDIMQAESQQWRTGNSLATVSQAYTDASQTYLSATGIPFLRRATGDVPAASGWQDWKPLFDVPVNTRLTASDDARYCVFVRGGALNLDADLLIVHVAVVFPSADQIFATGAGSCAATVNNTSVQLNPTTANNAAGSLQMKGFRVQYFGTQIARKDYLNTPMVSM